MIFPQDRIYDFLHFGRFNPFLKMIKIFSWHFKIFVDVFFILDQTTWASVGLTVSYAWMILVFFIFSHLPGFVCRCPQVGAPAI